MAKGEKTNRPSVQLLIDRDKVRMFRALCVEHGTTMSAEVEAWIDVSLKSRKLRTATPKRHSARPARGRG